MIQRKATPCRSPFSIVFYLSDLNLLNNFLPFIKEMAARAAVAAHIMAAPWSIRHIAVITEAEDSAAMLMRIADLPRR